MKYASTRSKGAPKLFSEILLEGLAPDGGLYVPQRYPQFAASDLKNMRRMTYDDLALEILSKFINDIPKSDLRKILDETYRKEIFGTEEITPLKELEPGLYLLGLSEGPTLSFKDLALQLLGRLFEFELTKKNTKLNILGATSGDTGSAAEYAMRGRRGVNVFMLSPYGRMSAFQRKQMYTLQDQNIFNIAIRGTFDDCQDIVKQINEDAAFKKEYKLGAVNSINWARIAAQVAYYFAGYLHATKKKDEYVSFAIPTGNFGNILAGYIAKRMGLPIRHLILATNENNVLAEFFQTGVYRPRTGKEVYATSSPSMDISKASNFERYVFDLVDRNTDRMNVLWNDLKTKGTFEISAAEKEKIKETGIIAGSSTHADRLNTIRSVYEKHKTLIDPHTADGITVGLKNREANVSLICLETAQSAKFTETIKEAIGENPPVPQNFRKIKGLSERVEIMDCDTERVKVFIRLRMP